MKPTTVVIFFFFFFGVACACEVALTHEEIVANRARGVEFSRPETVSLLGFIVNAAGDVNGDGLDDFVLAAPHGNSNYGFVYIVFGRSAAAWAGATFDFNVTDTPDASSWVKISGSDGAAIGSFGVASGDFNGDGLGDVLVSTNAARAYCIFGHRGNWSSFSVENIGHASTPGFTIHGGTTSNRYVGSAGDMNGDGIGDMLFVSGSISYVAFGTFGSDRASFSLSTLNGTNGFSLADGTSSLGTGYFMGSAGDVDGDGLTDLALGSAYANNNSGRAYILFARNVSATGQQWPAQLNLTALIDGSNGFIVEGPAFSQLGYSVVGAGDVNGDGFADIFIGSSGSTVGSSGSSGVWVVFGHPAPWEPLISASQLDGSNGFHFTTTPSESWGRSGGSAGDVNGDGFDDIVLGTYKGLNSIGFPSGAAIILFGRSGSWPAELGRNDVAGSVGFLIDGPSSDGSQFGWSAHGIGDTNGDGFADFVVGAPYLSNNGYALLVFGTPDDHCAVCSNTTNACLVCDDGFILNGTICEAEKTAFSSSSSPFALAFSSFSSASSAHQQGVSVVVIINFNETISDPTELQEEIASVLGIDAGLVSVVVISPTEVEVTIIGSEETAQHLVDIINNGGAGSGSGSGLGLLRKAIDAHIRKDTDGSSADDGDVDAAPHVALLCPLLFCTLCSALLQSLLLFS